MVFFITADTIVTDDEVEMTAVKKQLLQVWNSNPHALCCVGANWPPSYAHLMHACGAAGLAVYVGYVLGACSISA